MIINYNDIKDIELGAIYSKKKTIFRVFADKNKRIDLLLTDDYRKLRKNKIPMICNEIGIFEAEVMGDMDGVYYTFLVDEKDEVTDPYSKASSINSLESCVIDLKETNPLKDEINDYRNNDDNKSILIYELSVKDFTGDKNSGAKNRGKYLGLAEENTRLNQIKTGIDHLKELGISHIQLMPIFDFMSTFEDRENFFDDDNYNWGYDPELYFNVEGSYSTNPKNPKNRIYELKYLINEIHKSGMKVVMDVVYNHSYKTKDSNFEILYPKYYHRITENGDFSNGSGVGNELDSQKPFVRKLIIDSLKYWASEFKIDGLRFDLMALIDIDTIKMAIKELKLVNPDIIVYGEPWMALPSTLDYDKQIRKQSQRSNGFAVFNDQFRDALKGDNDGYSRGYIQGDYSLKNRIEEGIAGSIFYDKSRVGFCDNADEVVNYFNCHDNLILHDKLMISLDNINNIEQVTKVAFGILFLSLGKVFIYEGNEFSNTKFNDRNAYNAPLSINGVNWTLKEKNRELFAYVKDLIKLRKENSIFSITDADEIRKKLKFIEFLPLDMIGFTLKADGYVLLILINAGYNDKEFKNGEVGDYLSENLPFVNKIRQIFSKSGKVNTKVVLKDFDKFGRLSVNVYRME